MDLINEDSSLKVLYIYSIYSVYNLSSLFPIFWFLFPCPCLNVVFVSPFVLFKDNKQQNSYIETSITQHKRQ